MINDRSCRVYVGNLAWKVRWQDLKEHMRQAGDVAFADVFLDATGKSKGCGTVQFTCPEDALAAMKLTDTILCDRPIFVREDREELPERQRNFNSYGRGGYNRGGYNDYQHSNNRYHQHSGGRMSSSSSSLYNRMNYNRSDREKDNRKDFNRDRTDRDINNDRSDRDRMNRNNNNNNKYYDKNKDNNNNHHEYNNNNNNNDNYLMPKKQIFVSNLPWRTSWQDLKDLFREAGNVIRADVFSEDGRPKGTGIVLFEDEEESRRAIEMFDKYDYHGRPLSVRYDRYSKSGRYDRYDRYDRKDL